MLPWLDKEEFYHDRTKQIIFEQKEWEKQENIAYFSVKDWYKILNTEQIIENTWNLSKKWGVKIYSLSFLKVLRYTAIRRSENEKIKTRVRRFAMKKKKGGSTLPRKKKGFRSAFKSYWQLYVLVLPAVLYFFVFNYLPLYGIQIAFKDYKITRGIEGSSWSNPWYKWFLNFFTDPYFGRLLKNTFLISGLTILFGFPAPIILALMINEVKNSAFKRTVQTITYMPYFTSFYLTLKNYWS